MYFLADLSINLCLIRYGKAKQCGGQCAWLDNKNCLPGNGKAKVPEPGISFFGLRFVGEKSKPDPILGFDF